MDIPETRYTKTTDGTHIAYQVVGDGPFDIVFAGSSYTSNVEALWDWPLARSLATGLAARGRVIIFDRRGTGLSDKVTGDHLPTLEARAEDIHAVMDAAEFERAVLSSSRGWIGDDLRLRRDVSRPCEGSHRLQPDVQGELGTRRPVAADARGKRRVWTSGHGLGNASLLRGCRSRDMPTLSTDPGFVRDYARLVRQSISAADAMSIERMWFETDLRDVLPSIQAPSLIIYDLMIRTSPEEEVRYVAQHIPGGAFAAISGTPDWKEYLQSRRSLPRFPDARGRRVRPGARHPALYRHRRLDRASDRYGGPRLARVARRHHATVRAMLGRYRGREISTAGDGFLATFEGPARAIRCARAITEAVQPLGLEIRAGLHTGEIEMVGEDVRGVAVHIGARVAALAGASEVLVSQTVKDLVAGSGISFEDAGEHELKGVPDRWHLYRVAN